MKAKVNKVFIFANTLVKKFNLFLCLIYIPLYMNKIERVLIDQKIINKAELAKRIGLSKQVLNNKIKGNNGNSLTEPEKVSIRTELTTVLAQIIQS